MFNWFEHGGTVPPTRRLQRQNKNDMEKNDHHSSEWHLWDSSYFLLLGEWYSYVIRREKEYGTVYQTRVCLGKILSLVPGFYRY